MTLSPIEADSIYIIAVLTDRFTKQYLIIYEGVSMNRRYFLANSAVALFSVSTVPLVLRGYEEFGRTVAETGKIKLCRY